MSLQVRPNHPWLKAAFLLTGALVLGLMIPWHADAAPRRNLEQVRAEVEMLNEQAEAATERYHDLGEQIAGLKVRLTAARAKLADQRKVVAAARAALGQVAVDTYKAGDLATLSLFFSDRPDQMLAANDVLVSLGDRKARAVEEVLRQQQLLVAAITDVEAQQQRLQKTRRDHQAARLEVERKLSEATALLARLSAAERERLGRLQTGREQASLTAIGIKVPASGRLDCEDVPVLAPDARVAKVLAYACAQLGDPYRWAAEGPHSFDCSGLTMMAWRQAGVSLPRSSQLQARVGQEVSMSQLRPGDLVFFRASLNHVGIYIGKGLMLHAPQTGDVVKIAPMRYNSSFATAVRL